MANYKDPTALWRKLYNIHCILLEWGENDSIICLLGLRDQLELFNYGLYEE